MKTRAITGVFIAIVYVAVVLLSIYVHELFFDIFVLLIALFGALEVSRALASRYARAIDWLLIFHVFSGYAVFKLADFYVDMQGVGMIAYFGILALTFILSIVIASISSVLSMRNVVATMVTAVYPITVFMYTLGLNYVPDYRVCGIMFMFIVPAFTDTFAYLVGSWLKGPKLCPTISPKKTVSGAIGGLLGGMLGSSIIMLFSFLGVLRVPMLSANTGINVMHYLLIGFGGSILTQIGDLIASWLKRMCEIKDFGNLLPGHGGILDRVDGMMLATVYAFTYLHFLAFL